ncbi:MAG: IS3 family transposase [Gammaproteobacteria bacterium]|nr:IS3 family transposase [Gammaproteobacteria bacterium]MYF03361.1 IS3 family transposase [Gammaproteobacteria bacterium]MYI76745.1 IS3 family transposase [Gammaproteobacteria bacterium]
MWAKHLSKGHGLVRDGDDQDPTRVFEFIDVHQAEFTISALCRQFRVSRSGHYAWRDRLPSPRSDADQALMTQIKAIHTASRGVYGTPRIHATLHAQGVRISRRRVARLMLQQGLRGICRRRRKGRPKRTRTRAVPPDQVRRSFHAERPNQLWVADATYIPTAEGPVYLAAIQDVFSRRVVGWSLSARQDAELMVRALQMVIRTRRPTHVIHHSGHGSLYVSLKFRQACAAANVKVSMGSVGDCYDNAMAESLFATLETELIDRQPRHRVRTRAEANREVFSYLEGFYNLRRIHSALDYRSPVAYERRYALEQGSTANPKMNCLSN